MALRASYINDDNRNQENRIEYSYLNEPLSCDDGVTHAEMSSDNRPSQTEASPNYSMPLRCMKTVAQTFCSLGISAQLTLVGTTILHLSVLFNKPIVTLSAAGTAETICLIAGMIIMSLVVNRLEFEFIIALTTFTMGLANTFMLIAGFPGLIAIMVVRGFAVGSCIPVSSLYMVDTWHGTRFRDMAVQLTSAAFSIGATVAPFVISLFLAELPSYSTQTTNNSTLDSVTNSQMALSTTPLSTDSIDVTSAIINTTTDTVHRIQISDVRYSYAILGLAAIVCSLPAMLVYCYGGLHRPCLRSTRQTTGKVALAGNRSAEATVPVTSSRKRKVGYVSLVIAIGFVDAIIRGPLSAFLTPFALRELKWSASDSALLMSVYNGATGVAHVIVVFLALIFSPGVLLAGDFILTAIGHAAFLGVTSTTVAANAPVAVWLLAAVIALGESTMPSTLLLLLFNDTSTISMTATLAAKLTGASVSGALSAVVVGYLFEQVSPFWIVYIPLIALVVQTLLLFVRHLFLRTAPEQAEHEQRLPGMPSEKTVGDGSDPTTDNATTSLTKADEKTRLQATQQSTA